MNDMNLTGVNCPSIDDFRNQVYTTSYSLITVLGLLGNGIALVVLIKTNRKNLPFHIYMLNLAVSDLLCVMTLPMRVHYYVNKGQWNLGDFLCRISSYTFYVNLYCSIYFMAAMSITRFLAIVYPVRNLQLVTESRARMVCVAIWLFICLSASPFLMSGQQVDHSTNTTKCFEIPKQTNLQKVLVMNYVSLVIGFSLPFLVILICYAGIIRTLITRSHTPQRQRATGVRAIRMIVIVLVTFLTCFLPYHVQRTLHLSFLSDSKDPCSKTAIAMQKSVVVTLCLSTANTCFDPLLYFFSGESFRNRLASMRHSQRSSTVRPAPRKKTLTGCDQAEDNPRIKELL